MTASKHRLSPAEAKERRLLLKKQKSARFWESFWRFTGILGLSVGVFWWITLPEWVIRDSQQINIQGNEFLSTEEVRNLIPLQYPQPILTLSGDDLTQNLTTNNPIEDVTVIKNIFPPRLTLRVTETKPIALAFDMVEKENGRRALDLVGFLNEDGVFVDKNLYQDLQQKPEKLPTLRVVGTPSVYLSYWQNIYSLIQQSSIPITEINWQNPTNLILTTDLGKVHLGGYTSKFPQQLTVLATLKPLTQQVKREDIIYIDLVDPQMPFLQQKVEVKNTEQD